MGSGFRWLLQNYLQTWDNTACTITFTTDIPVHAWLNYTDTPPRMHLQSMTKRGLRAMKDPYYCFVAYHTIEQEQAGDTLIHTFVWPGWYDCLWQWFYFWATIAGVRTPTQWGIFKKHYREPVPPWGLIFHEPWTIIFPPPPEMGLIFLEPWGEEPPVYEQKFLEPWTS